MCSYKKKKKNIRCDGRTLNEILFQVFGFLMKVQGIAPEGLSPAIKKKKRYCEHAFSMCSSKKKNIKKGSEFQKKKNYSLKLDRHMRPYSLAPEKKKNSYSFGNDDHTVQKKKKRNPL